MRLATKWLICYHFNYKILVLEEHENNMQKKCRHPDETAPSPRCPVTLQKGGGEWGENAQWKLQENNAKYSSNRHAGMLLSQ